VKISYKDRLSLPENIVISVEFQNDDEVDVAGVTDFVRSLRRKPGWYTSAGDATRDTRDYVLNNPGRFGSTRVESVDPFTGLTRFEWECSQCRCGTTYGGIDLGHRNNWKDELIAAGVLNAAEAKAVYNNLVNLRIECASCNRSHDWED
jgi:HNH/ENDO VII superfamily nuclease with conserved GHE residues